MELLMEFLRRAVRSVLGSNSALYSGAASAYNSIEVARREGLEIARTLDRLKRAERGPAESLRLHNLEHPILVRPGKYDVRTIVNNIVREEYGKFAPRSAPLGMIDAGAYIGDSTAYFASKYPGLKIVALEPHPANYAMAKQNLEAYGERVVLLNMALGSARETVMIAGERDSASVGGDGAAVEATTVPDLLQRMGWERVHILKMDIEGAEADVLGPTADAWLDRVDMLIIELHGPQIERQVRETLGRNGFGVRPYRSLWYCVHEPGRA
jgi:FkbM family methyltransferase